MKTAHTRMWNINLVVFTFVTFLIVLLTDKLCYKNNHSEQRLSSNVLAHSERRLFTGFANATLIALKLMVARAMITAASPPAANNHQLMSMRYA